MHEVNHESRSGGIPRPQKCPDDNLASPKVTLQPKAKPLIFLEGSAPEEDI
jgi:hypothetical protein